MIKPRPHPQIHTAAQDHRVAGRTQVPPSQRCVAFRDPTCSIVKAAVEILPASHPRLPHFIMKSVGNVA